MSEVWRTVTRMSCPTRLGASRCTVHAVQRNTVMRRTRAGYIPSPIYADGSGGIKAFRATVWRMRRAKIVCTLGPATRTPEMIGGLIDAGMDVARLNFSHGDYDSHAQTLRMVRAEAQKRGRAVGILQDLQGPKIRVGKFASGAVELVPGAEF